MYHNIPNSQRRSRFNAQGQEAPEGYHYMPDGSLMSDAEHLARYGSGKFIRSFVLDTTNIRAGGEVRSFTVTGDGVFSLEVKNEDNYYYNFVTGLFQVATARLDNISIFDSYTGTIRFPKVTDADQYDFFLFAEQGSKHARYNEVRFDDGSLDINSSTGSNSLLLTKVIFQTLDVTLTLSTVVPSSAATFTGHSQTNKVITTGIGKSVGKIPFSIPVTAGSTHSFKINRTPTSKDVASFITRTVGSEPENITGENIHPGMSTTLFSGEESTTVDGAVSGLGASNVKVVVDSLVADKMKVGDRISIARSIPSNGADPADGMGGGTVDGAVTSGVKVVLDQNVAGVMVVGDRIETSISGSSLEKAVITVAALNPDGDNVKEFSMSQHVALSDGQQLFFVSKLNRETSLVTALNPDGDNTREFTMDNGVNLRDGMTLQFTNRKNYSWPINNVDGIVANMVVTGTNIVAGTVVSSYQDVVTEAEGTVLEVVKVKKYIKPIEKLAVKPVIAIDATTKLKTVTQTGNITFSKQQPFALAGDSDVVFYGYGRSAIKSITDWDVEFSDLKITLTKPTAVTTSAVSASATVPIDNGDGIMDDVSTVSSFNISSTAANPTVTNIAGYSGSTATLTLSAAQTLEDGETLTFDGAGRTVTISGNVEVKSVGEAAAVLSFDLEKFLTATNES